VSESNSQQYADVLIQLLTDRSRAFSVAQVARMLRLPEAVVAEANGGRTNHPLSWQDVIALGLLHRWTIRMVAEVSPSGAIPQALATQPGEISLPAYQWAVLAHSAELRRAAGMDPDYGLSDAVEEAVFHYVVSCVGDWRPIEQRCPTAERAAMWPGER
jgi:hypothetical protein